MGLHSVELIIERIFAFEILGGGLIYLFIYLFIYLSLFLEGGGLIIGIFTVLASKIYRPLVAYSAAKNYSCTVLMNYIEEYFFVS